jgi:hypothetical protein
MVVGFTYKWPSSSSRFRIPSTSVEQSNKVTDSAHVDDGAVKVCIFETNEIAAPFIITIRQPWGLGSLKLASPKAYMILSPWGSRPFEYMMPISFVVSAYSKSLMAISKCFFDHPDLLDPRTEIAYRISNLQFDAG